MQLWIALCCGLLLTLVAIPQPSSTVPVTSNSFKLPPGFSITQVAGADLANDIYCMTFSPSGELLVSGRGYIKQLVDTNADGKFDQAVLISDHPKDGAMGLLVDGDKLYAVGDSGIRRMPWKPGTYQPTSELLYKLKTGGEHDTHAIKKGPDGNFYALIGNTAASKLELKSKPIFGGVVLKLSADFKNVEVICDGFRNAYDMDWNLKGELYTYDSDNERCMGLPWYEGCRFYRVEKGAHYGWRTPQYGQFWRLPSYHDACRAPVLDLGRGSPTGVVCYRHEQFPEEYRDNFFVLDWTFGNVHRVDLNQIQPVASLFLQVGPGQGLAPTSAAIHPKTGDLYLSSGGRGTAGAVYRVRHDAGFKKLSADAQLTHPSTVSALVTKSPVSNPVSLSEAISQWKQQAGNSVELSHLTRLQSMLGTIGTRNSKKAFLEGYALLPGTQHSDTSKLRDSILTEVRQRFPSSDERINRELARTFALFGDNHPQTLQKLVAQLTPESSPIDDVHHLFVLACLPTVRTAEQRNTITNALLGLEAKYEKEKMQRERHWFARLLECVEALLEIDPEMGNTIAAHPQFGHSRHLLYLASGQVPVDVIASRLAVIVEKYADYEWTPRLIEVLGKNPSPSMLKRFRQKWEEPALRDALLPVIFRHTSEADRNIFIEALSLQDSQRSAMAMLGLTRLSKPTGEWLERELVAILTRLKQEISVELAANLRARLQSITDPATPDPLQTMTVPALEKWILRHYPGTKARIAGADGIDLETWKSQRAHIKWENANLTHGEKHFTKLCAACHQGSGALGPDLHGIGKRFSRDDILTAILQPNKDVSNRYRTTIYVTQDGQVHSGLVIYEAIDGVMLQTGADASIRIPGNQLGTKRTSDRSLMPAGLLDKLSDEEVAGLIGWLQRY
jgi:putative heme-binding domain-containing protein